MTQHTGVGERSGAPTVATVARAELRAVVRQGGMLPGLLLALVSGALTGAGTLTALKALSGQDTARASIAYVTPPIEAAGFVAIAVVVLVVVIHSGRAAQNGAFSSALLLVPRRTTLVGAKVVAAAVVSAMTVLAATSIIAAVSLAAAGSTSWIPQAVLAVISATSAAALSASVSLLVAVALGRVVPAILVVLGLWLLLPTALGLAAATAPAALAAFLASLLEGTPASLLGGATTVSTAPVNGYGRLVLGQLGLLLWAGALAVVATSLFRRRSL